MESAYKCVTTISDIEKYLGQSKTVAFDFETAPDLAYRNDEKAALDPARAHIVGCSFSVKEGTGIYVPIAHCNGENINKEVFIPFLKAFLTDRSITKIAHNIAFESSMAYAMGTVIQAPVYDTICAAQLTLTGAYEFRKIKDCGLKKLANEFFAADLPEFTDVTNGRHFDELNADDWETVRYGAADSDFALRLYHLYNHWFDTYLPKHRYLVENVESPTAVYIGIMKCNGIPIDKNMIESRQTNAENDSSCYQDLIRNIIGDVPVGANCSTQAFRDYLFQTLKLPVLKTTESNKEAIDDETIIMLREWCEKNRPELSELFELIQKYRKVEKIKTTYIDGYIKCINPVTGRIHPDMFALSTETGRMSCRNPNAQNMPRKTNDPIGIRKCIKAPDGHLILSVDFSQIELRVGAFYCRDQKMLETYRDGGDIHAATTSVIFGESYEQAKNKDSETYKEHRTIAKNVNFGIFYGIFPRGLQKTLKFKAGIDKSVPECERIISNLKNGYRGLAVWQGRTKTIAARCGYTETWLGRRRYLPDINSGDWSKKSFSERCALNTPIQGTAADILKLAMVRILEGLSERAWLKPILQIHDELTFIIPENKLEGAVAYVRECMEVQPFPEFDLPLVAEAAAGPSFGELEDL